MKIVLPCAARTARPRAALKLAVIIAFAAFALAGLFSGRTSQANTIAQSSRSKNPLRATERNTALGLDHYDAHCASCHGSNGKEGHAADLTSPDTQSKTDRELFNIISKGTPGGMPAFGKSHKPTEIWQVIHFIRRLPTLTAEARAKLEAAIPPSARHKHDKKPAHDHHQQEQQHQHETAQPKPQPAQQEHHHPPAAEKPQQPAEKKPEPQHQHHEAEKPATQPSPQQPATKPTPPRPATQEHQHAPAPQQPAQKPATEHQHASPEPTQSQPKPAAPEGPVMTLAEIERMAFQNNPTLAQAESAIRAAQGRRRQAGMWPNPVAGYQLEEGAFRAFNDKSEHFFFVEQTIPLGGKLRKSRRIFEQEVTQAETEAAAQKQRVLNTVRMLYFEALGAQRRVELRSELLAIAREAVKITSELMNVGQADRPDYLESEIESQQVELELINAQNDYDQIWRLLASVVGMPEMQPARLAGDLESGLPRLNQEALMQTLLAESPEIKSARAEVERARAVIARAKAERVPDLFLRGAIGYSNEALETRTGPADRKTGPEASIEIGVTLPIFNRNQGGIAAAEAELSIAERDLKRLELALRVRLAQAFRDFNNAASAVERYRQTVLPRAERAYQLYLTSFRQMAASYPQVLIAQRTMFQLRESYLDALVELRQNAIQIEGFLLTGALDAPRIRSSESERVEMTGVRSGSQGSERDH